MGRYPNAIDPEDCGCTDCILDDSRPLDVMTPELWLRWALGFMTNRTSLPDSELAERAVL